MKHPVEVFVVAFLIATPVTALTSTALSQDATQHSRCGAPAEFGIRDAEAPLPDDGSQLMEVQAGALLRNGPHGSCEVSYRVPGGGTVELLDCGGEWRRVSYGTEIGYLPAAALDLIPDRAPEVE